MTATTKADLGDVLVIQHVDWEGPGLIADSLGDLPVRSINVVNDTDPVLPDPQRLSGLIVMGGPMGVHDDKQFPGLVAERRLLASAVEQNVPVMGVCLGAQLLASALGARVIPNAAREIGWAPLSIHDSTDVVLGPLAPHQSVLHWHSDAFEVPTGATTLATTEAWPCQAFRYQHAWALQFHIEVDQPLLAAWLAEDVMVTDAAQHLGPDAKATIIADGERVIPQLAPKATQGLTAFTNLIRERRQALQDG